MNEYNIDEEEPDQHWEGFKKILIWITVLIVSGIIVALKYYK